jgi:flagellin-like hook-associated protein FlgL
MRNNLLSLQRTQRATDNTQLRLSTGLKVNSALDNANSFFASQSLQNRSSDLSRLLDGMGQSIQVLKAANEGIELITSYLEQMQAVATEALDQANASGAAPVDQVSLELSFNTLITQIDSVSNDAGYRGTNLLDNGDLTVTFNEDAAALDTLTVTAVDFSTGNDLAIAAPAWANAAAVQTTLDEIDAALTLVRAQARTFGTNLTIIQSRQDFTEGLINTLKEGSDKLVVSDQNEEGAKMLALQTAQSLGVTSLSLASQAQQSILRLF